MLSPSPGGRVLFSSFFIPSHPDRTTGYRLYSHRDPVMQPPKGSPEDDNDDGIEAILHEGRPGGGVGNPLFPWAEGGGGLDNVHRAIDGV